MNNNELIMLQSLPLDIKVMKTKLRIKEWIDYYGENYVYISFSGGKDSTVLLHLVRQVNPNIKAVFVDTGLEFPELKLFVKKFNNVEILRPKLSFKQVLELYGYPVVSKEQANYIYDYRNSTEYMKFIRWNGNKNGRFKISEKWKYLVDAPFKISHKCCDVMKKEPVKRYEKETKKRPFIGMLADESSLRKQSYIRSGCNAFNSSRPISQPLGFWREQDILEYIYINNIEIAPVYGDVIIENGIYKTTLRARTGCVFCAFGIQKEKYPNRFQLLEKTHPKLHDYCINKLGFKEVCEFMKIPYTNKSDII